MWFARAVPLRAVLNLNEYSFRAKIYRGKICIEPKKKKARELGPFSPLSPKWKIYSEHYIVLATLNLTL